MRIFNLLLPAALIICTPQAVAGKLYKWIDADGNVRYSDHVPAEAAQHGRKELSDQGRVVDETGRALTPEEIKQRNLKLTAEQIAKRDAEILAVKYKQILKLYSDIHFLDSAYKVRLESIATAITLSKDRIDSMVKQRKDIIERVLIIEKSNPRVPTKFYSEIKKLDNSIMEQKNIIAEKEQEIIDTKQLHQDKRALFTEAKKWEEESKY